ncbi:MAG: exodeoxyribonuclease VII large subunit [Muribaculaceae bacterium]|nr:exodeoxyribonuclease VII large subunit [Muribaculaceae bacterium]
MSATHIDLLQLTRRLTSIITTAPDFNDVWVTAETSDLRRSGPHCYLELIQKDAAGVNTVARLRANIWGSRLGYITSRFQAATSTPLASGMKVLVKLSVSYHPVYGLAAVVNDIDPSYTLGDLMRHRMEIIARLKAEGVLELNKNLVMPVPVQKIAVISAPGAAGYGDFIHQLYHNPRRLYFAVKLFPAVMQGERTSPSIICALDEIAASQDDFDCVVIIRGGGATSDLATFDDYALAANVAQFPLPVIVGIGHERDTTVLDHVAHLAVKTPTAAAEWLLLRASETLDSLSAMALELNNTARTALAAEKQRLAYLEGTLAPLSSSVIKQAENKVQTHAVMLPQIIESLMKQQAETLRSHSRLLAALSPEATLKRGFSITRRAENGCLLTESSLVEPGTEILTQLASGTIKSKSI